MITKIEKALIDRLTRGLGQLAATVKSYNGELDDETIGTARLPLVMVAFGGAKIQRMNTRAGRHQSEATFVILVMVRSLRNETAGRHGGTNQREVGANQLIGAVRRLLDAQTLDGLVKPLLPRRVATVLNGARVRAERLTAYSIEYEVVYDDLPPLEDGHYPQQTDNPLHDDYIFNRYHGQLDPPDSLLMYIGNRIYDPTTEAEIAFEVETKQKDKL